MKRLLLVLVFSTGIPFHSYCSGLLLNSGDSFTFEFTNLDFLGPSSFEPRTQVGLRLFGLGGSNILRFDAFENFTSELPVLSTNLTVVGDISPVFTFGPAWQDLQGTYRVTMFSGAALFSSFFVTIITTDGDIYNLKDTPVPEPSPLSLIGAIGLPAILIFRRVKRLQDFS